MTTLMGADLNNIVKCQALSDEHVQFLVYQLLRGLKVRRWALLALTEVWVRDTERAWAHHGLSSPVVHTLGRDHPPGRCGAVEGTVCGVPASADAPPTPQDLKPSNVAVNEDCELRVRGVGWVGHGGSHGGA